eukprot:XP_019921643.1 PREDICTED: uncharacterized protein LOC105325650 [Crassostrea gigas]
MNNDTFNCIDCPRGFFGWNCKSTCPFGFYGQFCKYSCMCNASECHHVTGCEMTTATSHEPTKVRETLHQIESSPHPVKERWKPTVIPGAPVSLLTLAVVALSLVVLGLVFIIILMSLYIWKQTRSVLVVKGRRFVPNTDIMDYNQLQSSLDREDPGYTSPGSEEQQRAIGHRSEYMTTRSLEIAEMSTVYVTSLN